LTHEKKLTEFRCSIAFLAVSTIVLINSPLFGAGSAVNEDHEEASDGGVRDFKLVLVLVLVLGDAFSAERFRFGRTWCFPDINFIVLV
jgi:hypothetical protein